jgi:hypothetical protein
MDATGSWDYRHQIGFDLLVAIPHHIDILFVCADLLVGE